MIDLGTWSPSSLPLALYGERKPIRYGVIDCRETCHVHGGGSRGNALGDACEHDPFVVIVLRGTVALLSRLNLMSIAEIERHIEAHLYFGMPEPPFEPEKEVWLWFARVVNKTDADGVARAGKMADAVAQMVLQASAYEVTGLTPEEMWRAPRYREEED